jgi:hypothetical protein
MPGALLAIRIPADAIQTKRTFNSFDTLSLALVALSADARYMRIKPDQL